MTRARKATAARARNDRDHATYLIKAPTPDPTANAQDFNDDEPMVELDAAREYLEQDLGCRPELITH